MSGKGLPDVERRDLWGVAALTLFAFVLRAVHLTRFELWVDEAASWHFARLTASGRLLEQIALEPTPPLYYGLIGLLMRLFGESDLVLRLPSALIGAATVPAVFALGRRFFGRRAATLAAILLAVHPLHVFYSREARVYPLLLLESVLLWLVLRQALDDDRRRRWAVFGAVLLVACYSHFYGLFLAATAAVMILVWSPSHRARFRGLAVSALVGLAFAPYLVATLPHLRDSGAAWSVDLFYDKLPEERRFGRTVEMGLLGADYHAFLRQMAVPPTPAAVRWTSLLAQAGLLVLVFVRARRTGEAGTFAFLLAAWLLPLLIPWTINHWRALYHTGRHDFYVVGTLAVLLAAGLDELFERCRGAHGLLLWRRGALAGLVAAVLTVAVAQRLLELHRRAPTDSNRRVAAWIARRASPDDRVVALGIRRLVTEHYTRLAGSPVAFESFPGSTDGHPGWSDVETLLEDEAALNREGRRRLAVLEHDLAADATLFVLLRSYPRTATAVSVEWLVDRHLLEGLAAAGWRPVRDLENRELRVAAFRTPAPPGGS